MERSYVEHYMYRGTYFFHIHVHYEKILNDATHFSSSFIIYIRLCFAALWKEREETHDVDSYVLAEWEKEIYNHISPADLISTL